jgi:hypothetical protein
MSLNLLLVAAVLVSVTVVIHGFGINYWLRFVMHRYVGHSGSFKPHGTLWALIWSAHFLMLLHLVEVVIWALAYLLFVPGDTLDSWEKAVYFSFVTFTTLGYGDITLPVSNWRVLSGVEALNGILLVGWSTAFLFAIIQHSWKSILGARDVQ